MLRDINNLFRYNSKAALTSKHNIHEGFNQHNHILMNHILRPWNGKDLNNLVKHANNINIAKFLTDEFPYPYTTEKGKQFIAYACNANPTHIFAIEVNGEAAGGIGIHQQHGIMRKNAELGYWLSETYWGNGIISKAILQMVEYGFKTFDITRIYARPFGNNIASKRVLEKAGFKLEACIKDGIIKNNEIQDELIYAVRKTEG